MNPLLTMLAPLLGKALELAFGLAADAVRSAGLKAEDEAKVLAALDARHIEHLTFLETYQPVPKPLPTGVPSGPKPTAPDRTE